MYGHKPESIDTLAIFVLGNALDKVLMRRNESIQCKGYSAQTYRSGGASGPNIRCAFTSGWSQDHPRATFEKSLRSVPEVYLKPVFLDVPGMFLR